MNKKIYRRTCLVFGLVLLMIVMNFASCGAAEDGGSASGTAETLTDPSGAEITVPDTIESIVVLAPSITEMVIALGRGDAITGCDAQSVGLEGLPADLPAFDMLEPDMEQLLALKPDLLLVSNMSLYDQESPFQQAVDMGVCVACVPNAESIEGIYGDISFLAKLLGEQKAGETLADTLKSEIDEIAAVGKTITDKKTVYFEIAAAPDLYSFGDGVYINEMIEIIGAENILASQKGWIPVKEEDVVAQNPDVILTNVNYIDAPVDEILSRAGWEGVTAVEDGAVYYIDNQSSNLPNQNIVKALRQMAEAVYPEYFGNSDEE